ncbi:hypothetical protein Xcc3_17300 [Xanthomonas campestris pv. campestris]|nr:hypothetical protein Xcc3_17300 [Xanthomonas campestris pv. campestris]
MVASRDRQARRPAEREERATAPERPDETQELRGARACYGKPDRGALARAVRAGNGAQPGACMQAGGCRHGRGIEGVETRMKHWVFLAMAIVAEVMATAALTSSEGFAR